MIIMISVTHCISTIDINSGGPGRSVPTLCKGLSALGLGQTIFSHKTYNPNLELLKKSDVDVKLTLAKGWANKMLEVDFKQELEICKTDIFHGHSLWNPYVHWMTAVARKREIPYIISPRGTLEPWALQNRMLKKWLALRLYQLYDLKHAACIHATAEKEAEHIRLLGVRVPIAVIPNGIDLSQYPLKNSFVKNEKRTMLFLSRFNPKKGIDLLLAAWKNIDKCIRSSWQLKIVGTYALGEEAAYFKKMHQLVVDYDLVDEVFLSEGVFGKEKIQAYHEADLFILPTYSENFGMVVAEALACGTPVITTVFTPWKCLVSSQSGWWIELGVDQLTQILNLTMRMSPEELFEMGQRGRKLIEEKFSILSVANKFKELYEWLLFGGDKPNFILD